MRAGILGLAMLAISLGPTVAAEKALKIGMLTTLSGPNAALGIDIRCLLQRRLSLLRRA